MLWQMEEKFSRLSRCGLIDLILMDVKMPEMDGITATREIRKRWPEKGPKIVAITAYALEGDQGEMS